MNGELIFRPRGNGKVSEARERIFAFVAIGDVVTTEHGENAPRYRVFEKRDVDGEKWIGVTRVGSHARWIELELDPASIRLVFEGKK